MTTTQAKRKSKRGSTTDQRKEMEAALRERVMKAFDEMTRNATTETMLMALSAPTDVSCAAWLLSRSVETYAI